MYPQCYRYQILFLLFMACLTVGCGAHNLREAQDHFNKGAAIEVRAMDSSLLSDNAEADPGDALAALNEYRMANAVATASINDQSRTLKQDNLLGAAYVLKAMALWRVSDLEGNPLTEKQRQAVGKPSGETGNRREELWVVLERIKTLKENQEVTLGTRDKVLHKALYGFYDHDGGRAENDYAKAREWFRSAYETLGKSLDDNVTQLHPIRVYVGSAQLRTLAAWNLALYNHKQTCRKNPNSQSCIDVGETERKDDGKEIYTDAKRVICDQLQAFWDNNSQVRDSLGKLLATIGYPSLFNECSR
jgi:hypothetical protein